MLLGHQEVEKNPMGCESVSGWEWLAMDALIKSTLAAMAVATATANSRRKLPASYTNEWSVWQA